MDKNIGSIIRLVVSSIDINNFTPFTVDESYESVGTGFFISENKILTCAHVVANGVKTIFTIPGKERKKYEASVISLCFDRDIALLESIEYKSKTFLELGDSDKIKTEDSVTAIGYPLGDSNIKVTGGKISGRQNGLIQTYVPINKGNSGGPLLFKNKVIGVNSEKIIGNDIDGISYSIPINNIKVILNELKNPTFEDKIIYDSVLGVIIQKTNEDLRKFFGYYDNNGILIKKIIKESPLYKAGVRESDIVYKINDYSIDDNGDISVEWSFDKIYINNLFGTFSLDEEIKISFFCVRESVKKEITIKLDPKFRINILNKYPPFQKLDYEVIGGLVLMDLNMNHIHNISDENIETNKLDIIKHSQIENLQKKKILITSVLNGSSLKTNLEIKSGLFLININGRNVNTLEEFREYVKKSYKLNKNKYIYLKLSNKEQFILDINKTKNEDLKLSKLYNYKISNLY